MGFKPRLGPKALAINTSYKAGTIKDRLEDLTSMFFDDEIEAIFCTGGGYCSIQLLPEIDWSAIAENPKIIMGYSDITVLTSAIYEKTGLITFHGPNIEGLQTNTKGNRYTVENFKHSLMKDGPGRLTPFTEWKTLKAGRAEGVLMGGNFNVLLSLMGTPHEPKWDDKILFLEEVTETIEGLENYLWRLRVSKVFKKIEGLIIGKITDIIDIEDEVGGWANMDKPPVLEDIILQATEGYNFPILYGADFGHDVPSLTLPVGAKARLDCPAVGRTGKIFITDTYLS